MAFTISEFRAAFPEGLARPNLWDATIFVRNNGTLPPNFTFRCEKADIPGRTVATIDDVGSGPALKIPYDVNYNDAEITIICGNDFTERKFFEKWIDSIVLPFDNVHAGLIKYYDNYAKGNKLYIRQISEAGRTLLEYTLHDIYPISISPMNLSWEESNTYQRFNVTLNYRYYDNNI